MLRAKDIKRVMAARKGARPVWRRRPGSHIQISLFFTADEYLTLRRQAATAKLPMSEFIRSLTCR